jgi:hypothetical protein
MYPLEERCKDGLRPRLRLRGEGEAMTAFWESVRVHHGFATRACLAATLRRMVREGRLTDAFLLAVQHDREVIEQCEAEARPPEPNHGSLSAGGPVPVQNEESARIVEEWSRPWRPGPPPPEPAPPVKTSFDPRWTTTDHLPRPMVAEGPPPRTWRDE